MIRQLWKETVAIVIAGRERLALPEHILLALKQAGIPIASTPATGAVLEALCALRLLDKCAVATQQTDVPTPANDAQASRRLPESASPLLRLAFSGPYAQALPELARWLADSGKYLPASVLPDLLNLYAQRNSPKTLLSPLLDDTARWLAAQNPEWATAVFPAPTDWVAGATRERVEYLRQVRTGDRQAALDLLAASWPTEDAYGRQALLDALDEHPDASEAEFLENCLTDRSKAVRKKAAGLLLRIPESSLQKAAEKALALGEPIPEILEKAGVADWTEAASLLPPAVSEKYLSGDAWIPNLFSAALLHRDADAMLRHLPGDPDDILWESESLQAALSLASDATLHRLISGILHPKTWQSRAGEALLPALAKRSAAWPAEWAEMLQEIVEKAGPASWPILWEQLPYRLPVREVERLLYRWEKMPAASSYPWSKTLAACRGALRFRQRLHTVLQAT